MKAVPPAQSKEEIAAAIMGRVRAARPEPASFER